jgi:glycosyltransferase involved in cell wall biosynthesis
VTYGGAAEAVARADWQFRVVGLPEDVGAQLGFGGPVEGTGPLEIDEWHPSLGQLDVGIVPLASSQFNEAKSTLKGLEYAAHGIPFVASPLPEYEVLAQEGIGLLAKDRGRTWRAQLLRIMQDDVLRAELSQRGRELVRAQHTYETQGALWLDAWESAIDNRRRSSR